MGRYRLFARAPFCDCVVDEIDEDIGVDVEAVSSLILEDVELFCALEFENIDWLVLAVEEAVDFAMEVEAVWLE